jgi:hypothetical protein
MIVAGNWADEAGIKYWKVDYVSRGGDLEFIKLATKIAKEEAPKLWVEHYSGGGPLNDMECPWNCKFISSGEFKKWCEGGKLKFALDQSGFAQILRSYDVTAYLSVPTTLDRVAQILYECSGKNQITGILNCEKEATTKSELFAGNELLLQRFREICLYQLYNAKEIHHL